VGNEKGEKIELIGEKAALLSFCGP